MITLPWKRLSTFTKSDRAKDRRSVDLISDVLPFGQLWLALACWLELVQHLSFGIEKFQAGQAVHAYVHHDTRTPSCIAQADTGGAIVRTSHLDAGRTVIVAFGTLRHQLLTLCRWHRVDLWRLLQILLNRPVWPVEDHQSRKMAIAVM